MNNSELYDKAREKWSMNSQFLIMVEEMSEFSVEILHLIRGGEDFKYIRLIEEYVDVKIMMEQFEEYMKLIDKDFEKDSAVIYNEKINRLIERLK
jgi:hypothetical protein